MARRRTRQVEWELHHDRSRTVIGAFSAFSPNIQDLKEEERQFDSPVPQQLIPGERYDLHLIFRWGGDGGVPNLPEVVGGLVEFVERRETEIEFTPTSNVEYCYFLIADKEEDVKIPAFDVVLADGETFEVEEALLSVKSKPKPTRVRRETPDCMPLLSSASLSIYRSNSFRVTGLAVDVTNKQAKRRADELKTMQEAGLDHPSNAAMFALTPAPAIDDIRHAMQRLDDPEQRLVDEFFWFWPTTYGQSESDPALQALANGDSSKAYEIWSNGESDPGIGYVATHNIAIMFHMIAIDWTVYHLATDLDQEREEKIHGYWKEAFKQWEKIVLDDKVWDAVKERIRSIDEARLTTGFSRRMRDSLPEALDKINAEAALRFAELHRLDWARIHIELMNESHQGLDDVDKTAAQVLLPTRNRVLQHIATAKAQIGKQPAEGCWIAETLLDQTEPLEQLFELFHGCDSHHKTELFDEVAVAVNSLVVAYQNKASGDPGVAVSLYQRALRLATAMDLRQLIQSNIGVGTKSIKGRELQPIFNKLKQIQESKASAKSRFSDIKTLVPSLEQLGAEEGEDSALYSDLADALAVVLRGIAITANNDEKDPETALHAIYLAKRLAKDTQLKDRITLDHHAALQNITSAQLTRQQTRRSSSGCLVLILSGILGAIGGVAVSGGSGLLGGGAFGLMAGSAISKIIQPTEHEES